MNEAAVDIRNQILLLDKYGNNFSITTALLLLIALILIFYINEKKKLNNLCILTLVISTFSVFFISLITDYSFATDRYNFVAHIPEFREQFFIKPITRVFIFRASENASLIYSFLPLPTPKTLLDLGLFTKCIYLAFIFFIISKDFQKKKKLIYFIIFFPLFHFYSSTGGKECLVFILAYFWSESLINKKIILNLIISFIFVIVKFEFGFLVAASSIFYFIMKIEFFKKYFLLLSIIAIYIASYYLFERYNYYINWKFRGFSESGQWLQLNNLNDFILRLIKSYFTSPIKIMNFESINLLKIGFSLSLIFSYLYFYLETIKIKKISYELIFILTFKIIFCGIYTLMIDNWGTYQRLIFTPIILSIFMTINYSISFKNEK